jgi:hypothetical protein
MSSVLEPNVAVLALADTPLYYIAVQQGGLGAH